MTDIDSQREETPLERSLGAHLPIAGERLKGRAALVSGAGCAGDVLGIGAATAILFAAQGAGVTIFDIDRTRGAKTTRIIERLGGRAMLVTGDVRSAAACADAVARTVERFGSLDVLVNNTAVTCAGDINTVAEADWDRLVEINLTGVMRLSRAAMPELAKSGGSIVNLASIAAEQGFGTVAYAATKGGVIAMTRDMALTAGQSGVRVNCIAPGHLATPMGRADDLKLRDVRRRATMLGVEGSAWDAAWAALFLAGPEARWITAVILNVDAGSTSMPSLKILQSAE